MPSTEPWPLPKTRSAIPAAGAGAGANDTEPRWSSGLDRAELSGVIGARFRDLARHDPTQARHAVTHITNALELRDPIRTRNRVFDTIGLARVHLITSEPEQSADLIIAALPLVDRSHPGRVARKLRDWCREATRYGDAPMVRETQDRVRELVTTAV